MKKIILTLCSLLALTGCDGSFTRMEDCMNTIPASDITGVVSATQYVHYTYYETFNPFTLKTDYHESRDVVGSCNVTCQSGYSETYKFSGARCLENITACSASELPANAIRGFKSLISSYSGSYTACQVMECDIGYTIQSNNTCQANIIIPPPNPCMINPADPMCMPPIGP